MFTGFAKRQILLMVLLLTAVPLHAQFTRVDRNLIDKLYRGDFANISDDNFGRMDLEAVVMAFRADDRVPEQEVRPVWRSRTDRSTNGEVSRLYQVFEYGPRHRNISERSIHGFECAERWESNHPGVWALDPNMLAMALEIDKAGGCTDRAKTIRLTPYRGFSITALNGIPKTRARRSGS